MNFTNKTFFPSLIHRTSLDDDIIAMSVTCRITFDIAKGKANICEEQEWELHQDYWESDYGPMDKDDVYKRGGVDIMVFGSAKTPKGKKESQVVVSIFLNKKEIHKVNVFGERRWKSFMGKLYKSDAKPFKEIALSLNNAYGGVAKWDGLDIPYPANPYGKGYYHTKEEAVGKVLPNIEHIDEPISKWREWQDPAGVGSFPILPLKSKNYLQTNDDKTKILGIDDKFYNSAFPELIVDEIKEGDEIAIEGVTGGTPFKFVIPKVNIVLSIKLGDKKTERKMIIDQVGVLPDNNQVFISYRFPFRYQIVPLEKREFILNLK